LVGIRAVGRHVHHEGSSSTTIEEVDRTTNGATSVRRCETAAEVWEKVDSSTVDRAWSEDTWDGVHVWCCVYGWSTGIRRDGMERHVQLPMTAVLTTRVNRVIWFAAVLFINRAVV
jgi:hypothetical protein